MVFLLLFLNLLSLLLPSGTVPFETRNRVSKGPRLGSTPALLPLGSGGRQTPVQAYTTRSLGVVLGVRLQKRNIPRHLHPILFTDLLNCLVKKVVENFVRYRKDSNTKIHVRRLPGEVRDVNVT